VEFVPPWSLSHFRELNVFITSNQPYLQRTLADALVAALSARPAAALLITPFVHLYTAAAFPPSENSVPGDFTEAVFVGYAPIALTLPLTGPINLGPANTVGGHNDADFIAGAVVPPGENIVGYWIDEAAVGGATVYASESFPAPIPVVNPGDTIALDVIFGIGANIPVA
jgi:hypothetical protein